MTHPATLARRLRYTLNRDVDPTLRALTGAWARAYLVIRNDLVTAVEDAALAGALSPNDFRSGRLGNAMNEASRLLAALSGQTGIAITTALPRVVAGSVEVSETYFSQRTRNLGLEFARLNPSTLNSIVLRTTQRIASATPPLNASAQTALRDNLVRAVARGSNPRDAARLMVQETRGVFGGGMTRALTLARTEMIDAHRGGSAAVRQANGMYVTGWLWSARLDTRTCPACWAMHGTEHPSAEVLEGHQNCRCVPVPKLIWDDDTDLLPPAAERFAALPREQQVRIMGPGRMAALERGVPLSAMATRRDNPNWRPGHYATPVGNLTTA